MNRPRAILGPDVRRLSGRWRMRVDGISASVRSCMCWLACSGWVIRTCNQLAVPGVSDGLAKVRSPGAWRPEKRVFRHHNATKSGWTREADRVGLFRRKDRDDTPVDMNARSPQLGIRFKDLAVLGALAEQGADLTEPRHIIYYSYAPSEAVAHAMARDAEAKGFTAAVKPPLPEARGQWSVICEVTATTSPEFVVSSDDFFQDLADRNDAEYDGWEASVDGRAA